MVEGQDIVVIPNQEGDLTTPSIVGFKEDSVLVGELARRQAVLNPTNTFYSVKRFIGKQFSDCFEDSKRVPFRVVADPDGSGDAVMDCSNVEGSVLYPEEISAHVVAKLIKAAEVYSGRSIKKAVISVPAYFDDEQKEATVNAGRLAGLDTVRIIREPVAAALAYGISAEEDQTILVFDLGGGTYDVSLLEVGGGVIEVLSTGGDPHLGGDDWDNAIISWLIDSYLKPAGINCQDATILTNLKAVAEAAKIKLSTEEKVLIRMPIGKGIEAVLTRNMFEGMTVELFRQARLPLDQACWQAGVDLGTVVKEYDDAFKSLKSQKGKQRKRKGPSGADADLAKSGPQIRPKRRLPVSQVLLVGGATRMPAVGRFVKNMTGLEPKPGLVDPDLAVAYGAAVQAGIYEGSVQDLMIIDVWQASLMRAYAKLVQESNESDGDQDGDEDGDEEDSADWIDEELGETVDES